MRYLLALSLVACAAEKEVPPKVAGPAPVESAAPATAACPASFAATQATACTLGAPPTQCEYAEGNCFCSAPAQCGGVYMEHPLGSPGHYQCTPKSPSTLRSDGCPFDTPTDGAACTGNKSCSYGPCSWSRTEAVCKASKWSVVQHSSPPPP